MNRVIRKARSVTSMAVSSSWWATRLLRLALARLPLGWIMAEVDSSDMANRLALATLDKELGPETPGNNTADNGKASM